MSSFIDSSSIFRSFGVCGEFSAFCFLSFASTLAWLGVVGELDEVESDGDSGDDKEIGIRCVSSGMEEGMVQWSRTRALSPSNRGMTTGSTL